MSPRFKLRCVVLAACLLAVARAGHGADKRDDDQFVSMFNGKDLSEWKGAPGWWAVHDGVLVGESTPQKPCRQTHYLTWQGGEPGDFDLRASFRLSGEEANSGIQFRSEPRPDWDAWGYQADLDTAGQYTGCLYQHDRGLVAERGQLVRIDAEGRREVAARGDFKALLKDVRPGEWNEYRILAQGPKIKLWINGALMCEAVDHQEKFARSRGLIALQLHQGPPMKVEFKNLRIRLLE